MRVFMLSPINLRGLPNLTQRCGCLAFRAMYASCNRFVFCSSPLLDFGSALYTILSFAVLAHCFFMCGAHIHIMGSYEIWILPYLRLLKSSSVFVAPISSSMYASTTKTPLSLFIIMTSPVILFLMNDFVLSKTTV